MEQVTIPARGDLDPRFTWNAASVFDSDAAWDAEYASVLRDLPALRMFEGRLAEGPATLAEALQASQTLLRRVGKLNAYAGMDSAVDTTNQPAGERNSRANSLYGQALAAVAFIEPELLAIGQERVEAWLREAPDLAIYGHYLDNLLRKQAHVRSAEVEQLLGLLADPFSGPYDTFSALSDADLAFEPAMDSAGQPLPLSQGAWLKYLASPDRQVRRTAWANYANAFLAFKHTLASNLAASVKQNVFTMRARGHRSTLEMALFADNIPVEVFDNLIRVFRQHLPTWHRYWAVRRKILGVETLHPYDIWAPLGASSPTIPYGQAVDWLSQALAPLGEDYVTTLRRGCLQERWIDVYPNQGKRAGAFSSGAPGTHPFILMSYTDNVLSMGTLAHELGHSMHSYLAWQAQPTIYSHYSLFAAEVASNFHQAMLRSYLLNTADADRALQIGVIEEAMNNFHRYFLIMPTLARFELEIHQRAERGAGLTADGLIDLLADLMAEGYGDELQFDRQHTGILWATFPHLYADYYVFQYATGISGAHALASRVLSGQPGAAQDYLDFLRAGGSRYPLDALKRAGVDLATPQPVEQTFQTLAGLVDRLEQLFA